MKSVTETIVAGPTQMMVAITASPRRGLVGLNPFARTDVSRSLSVPLGWSGAMGGGGGGVGVTACEAAVVAPRSSVAVSVTVNVPAVAYVWDGFGAIDDAPSPKVQWY